MVLEDVEAAKRANVENAQAQQQLQDPRLRDGVSES